MLLATIVAAGAMLAAAASVHLPVSTNVPQAQALIDRGLFYYYAYNGPDAARAFEEAAASDPNLAMAYWGVALADGPDLNTPLTAQRFDLAQRAIEHADALDIGASSRERSFIEIMTQRYSGSFADWPSDNAAYRSAMLAFAQSSQDENAALLAAEALLEDGGLGWTGSAPSSDESRQALTLINDVLARDPANPMANHLCIHAHDLAPDRSPALACAQRLDAASFPPQAEHLAHMPAHYWIETGDYAAAVASSERAFNLMSQLDADPAGAAHVNQYEKHDVSVGYSAAMMLGNYALAQTWAQRMSAAFDESFDAITALRFGRYDQAYTDAPDGFGGPSVRGLAALHLDRLTEAHAIAASVHRAEGDPNNGYIPQLFYARVAEADGNDAEARRWIERAIANQHANFAAESIPLLPAEEALGGLLLRQGSNAGAVAAFNAALAAYPSDPRALYGLSEALAHDPVTHHPVSPLRRLRASAASTSLSACAPSAMRTRILPFRSLAARLTSRPRRAPSTASSRRFRISA
jgi:tetratricopeptide (TPR) repeat protein